MRDIPGQHLHSYSSPTEPPFGAFPTFFPLTFCVLLLVLLSLLLTSTLVSAPFPCPQISVFTIASLRQAAFLNMLINWPFAMFSPWIIESLSRLDKVNLHRSIVIVVWWDGIPVTAQWNSYFSSWAYTSVHFGYISYFDTTHSNWSYRKIESNVRLTSQKRNFL